MAGAAGAYTARLRGLGFCFGSTCGLHEGLLGVSELRYETLDATRYLMEVASRN